MNSMKEKLKKLQFDEIQIMTAQMEIDRLEDAATSVTPSYGGEVVSGSRNLDKLGDKAAVIADLQAMQKQLRKRRVYYFNLLSKIGDAVSDPDEAERQYRVLYKRYFEYKKCKKIAAEMRCSERSLGYLHNRALQTVEAIEKEGFND